MSSPIQKQFDELIQLISLAKFKEALDLVDEISKTKGISKEDTLDNMLFKSEIEYSLGNYKKSLQQAEKVLKESKELDNTKLIIKSLYRKIAALNILGKLNECLVLNEKAMKLMTEKNLLDDKAMLRTKLRLIGINGVILANTGKYDIGLEKIQQAIDLAEKSNDKQMFAFLTTHLGLYTLFSGDKEKAEKIINRAYKIALDLGNKLEIAIATLRLGVLKTYEQLHEEALELFFNSIEIAEETGSTHLFFATYLNIGETYRDLFQFDEAIKYMKKALTFESGYAFMINTDLAGVYYWKNELDLALEHFLISLEKSNELKDRRYNPLILYQLVNLYVQKKQFKEAEQHLNQLEKIRTEEKLKQYNEFYIVASIQFYKESSNIQDWSKAIDLAEEFLTRKDIPVGWRIDLLYTILEIRLRELQINANKESLAQVRNQIENVSFEAERMQLYNVIVNLYRLKSQLALVELDIKTALDMLVTARIIANEKGLALLLQEIQEEEKKLSDQISMWTKFQEQKLSIVDTLKQVSLESTAQNIAKDTVVEVRDEETGKTIEYRKLFALKI